MAIYIHTYIYVHIKRREKKEEEEKKRRRSEEKKSPPPVHERQREVEKEESNPGSRIAIEARKQKGGRRAKIVENRKGNQERERARVR